MPNVKISALPLATSPLDNSVVTPVVQGGTTKRVSVSDVRGYVSPEDFSGTDTVKFNAALATGKSVLCTAASYSITASLTPTAAGQVIDINGALLTCTGNFERRSDSISGREMVR